MHASNKPQPVPGAGSPALSDAMARTVAALFAGSCGWTVRCVPTRRTVVVECEGGHVYAKWRWRRNRDAAAEWRWLHDLPRLGVPTATPVAWLGDRRRSVLVTAAVAGRSFDSWARMARRQGWFDAFARRACELVAPVVRRLHDQGLVYRDLYWNHVFGEDPRTGAQPVFLDVERVLRPRWRWRRWVVKDLAGLLASAPPEAGGRAAVRFLRAYVGGRVRDHRALVTAVERKAARIRAHVPRFG